jgi:hypothetical protein
MKIGDTFFDNVAKCDVVLLHIFPDGDIVCCYKDAKSKFIVTTELYRKAKESGILTEIEFDRKGKKI